MDAIRKAINVPIFAISAMIPIGANAAIQATTIAPMMVTRKYIHPECYIYNETNSRYTNAINGISYLIEAFNSAFSGEKVELDQSSNPFFPLLVNTKEQAYIASRLQHTTLTLPKWELFIQKNTEYSYTFLYKYPS